MSIWFQAAMFRLPWKLWRYLEGGKIAEFGMEAKRHLVSSEAEEGIAHQYATAFYSALHRNNSYYAQVWSSTQTFCATWRRILELFETFHKAFHNGLWSLTHGTKTLE